MRTGRDIGIVVQVRLQVVQRWSPLDAQPSPQPPPPMQDQEPLPPALPRKPLQPPVIVTHPADLQVMRGQAAEFCVYARVSAQSAPHIP